MGLLYPLPSQTDEKDFLLLDHDPSGQIKKMVMRSYGLPWLFWGYAFACLMVIVLLFLAVKAPLLKLISLGDETDHLLGYSLMVFIALLPLTILGFLFYEKRITVSKNGIELRHFVFGLSFFKEIFSLSDIQALEIKHHLDSPNMAKIIGDQNKTAFQNRGYSQLFLNRYEKSPILIDRHSQRRELEKIKILIEEALESCRHSAT
jgi:hypothetical protein